VIATAVASTGCSRSHLPAPDPLPSAVVYTNPPPAAPVRDVPACAVVRPDFAPQFLDGKPYLDDAPTNSGRQALGACGLAGVFAFPGHPRGQLTIIYGRTGPSAAGSAGDMATAAASGHLRGVCRVKPTPIAGSYTYGESCAETGPIRQETGVADKGSFVQVEVRIDDNGDADPAELAKQTTEAALTVATAVISRLNT
jgi:hypothetical protein